MSLTNDVKQELCGSDINKATKTSFIYGLIFGIKGKTPVVVTECESVAECFRNLFPSESIRISEEVKRGKLQYSVAITDSKLLDTYCYGENTVNHSLVNGNDAVSGAFLRGVFLVCGTVSVQKAGYHLELSLDNEEKCRSLHSFINEQGVNINISHRRNSFFLYSKNSENISDYLTFIGAMKSSMEIMNIKIIKEVRSNINRVVNCEAANIGKTAAAAAKQILDIRLIGEKKGYDKLDEDLRELALLRLENPEMSLSGLGELLSEPLSRSGINHRLKRIAAIAEEIRNKCPD